MARFRRVAAAGAIACILLADVLTGGAQTYRTGVELVSLPVVVMNRAGALVSNLASGDFEVLENGHPQVVTSFVEGAPGDANPLYLGLMLDRSRSMERDLTEASNAAVRIVTRLDEVRDVTLVDFDARIRIGRFAPASYPQLFERVRDRAVGEFTVLYDAVARYTGTARERDGLHVLVLYSDGADSRSGATLGQLIDLLRAGNVLVYAIGYLENQSSAGRLNQQAVLSRIARETGGDAFFPSSARDLDRIYARIVAEIQGRYTLGYVSSDRRSDGRFRRVEVRLTRPDLKGAKVRTRSGYIAPGP
jgi:Ca-activated chloride channel homolog